MFPVLISCGQRKFSVRDNIKEQRFLSLKWQYSQVAYTFIPFFRSIPVVGKLNIPIHWINNQYPADKHLENQFVLSTGWRFKQWIALSTFWATGSLLLLHFYDSFLTFTEWVHERLDSFPLHIN